MRLLLLTSCGRGLLLLRLTRLQLLRPFGVPRTKPGPGIRSCLSAGWDRWECVPGLLKWQAASLVALWAWQCLTAEPEPVRAASLARHLGDRRWQDRTNIGSRQ